MTLDTRYPTDAEERHLMRQQNADEAAAKALLAGRSLACCPDILTPGHDHDTCAGVERCLCPCHDVQGD